MRGTIRARGEGKWQVQVYAGRGPDGQEKRVARTVAGKRDDAERALRQLIGEVEAGQHRGDDPTVAELAEMWFAARQADWSPATARQYRHQLDRHILPHLGDVKCRKLRASDLDRLYAKLRASGLSAGTVRKTHTILSSMLTQAEKWDMVISSPARAATPPRVEAHTIDPPDPATVAKLLAALDDDPAIAAFVRLAATTGCRRGELCALQWDDIDLQRGSMLVSRALSDGSDGVVVKGTKTGRAKPMALDPATVASLTRWKAASNELALRLRAGSPTWVFPSDRDLGEPVHPSVMTHRWIKLRDAHGLAGVRLHDLRHFVASQMLAAGVDVRTVASRLGHANPGTTLKVYAHLIPEADRAAADTLAALLEVDKKSS